MGLERKLLLAAFGALAAWVAIEPNASADNGSLNGSQNALTVTLPGTGSGRFLSAIRKHLVLAAANGADTRAPKAATDSAVAAADTMAAAHEPAGAPDLRMPSMNTIRGRRLFASKGCVICHSVNGVGGENAPKLDAHTMKPGMNPFEFAAKMWRGAAAMMAMQEQAFGGQIAFTGDELADIIAFAHSDEEQHKFSKADIPANILALMDHMRAVSGGARTGKLGSGRVGAPGPRLATAEPGRLGVSAKQPIAGIANIPKTALPLEAITAKVIEAGFDHIHTIKFENGRYKVSARNARGKNVVLLVDPISGALRQAKVGAPRDRGSLLQVDAILKEVHGAGFRQVSSISRQKMIYQVIALGPRDRVVKLFLHPKTGALIRHPTSGKPIVKIMAGKDVSAYPAIESIVARVKAAGFAEVYSIEAEHGGYEVRTLGPDGAIVLLYFDPATGELLRHP